MKFQKDTSLNYNASDHTAYGILGVIVQKGHFSKAWWGGCQIYYYQLQQSNVQWFPIGLVLEVGTIVAMVAPEPDRPLTGLSEV